MLQFRKLNLAFAAAAIVLLSLPFGASADNFGDKRSFNIDKAYDAAGRQAVSATLAWVGEKVYFYADDSWWQKLTADERKRYTDKFQALNNEFTNLIYPRLTAVFGSDFNPVVNKDGKITVLVHPMVKDAGGYFNTGDSYLKIQAPLSNEREMIYLNTRFIDSSLAKSYLAHEFTHLISFNQKERLRNISEEVWLTEARSEYASTILGFDNPYEGSNFDQRVRSYSADSSKSLTDWLNKPANYGAAHLFVQYLVEQYGMQILTDSMMIDRSGIDSIEYALKKSGVYLSFPQIFRNWVVALSVNDCRLGNQYCFKNPDLKRLNIAPKINYLPNSDTVSLSVIYNTDYFSGNWQKIVGGGGDLNLKFASAPAAKFLVPYLICYAAGGECAIKDLELDGQGKGIINLPDFGRQYSSLTLMPFAAGKISGFDNSGANAVSYSFEITIAPRSAQNPKTDTVIVAPDDAAQRALLLAQIDYLKKEIARLSAILAARPGAPATAFTAYSCKSITADLYFGVENSAQVKCLQEVLKNQGAAVYPQAKVSGSFSLDTQAAVVRFQEKYAAEILAPLGLKIGTGYVGASTRLKLNRIIGL